MGIDGFFVYVERALKWRVDRYTKDLAGPPTDTSYIHGVSGLLRRRLGLPPKEDQDARPSNESVLRGICVDLSSFCYGLIVDAVRSDKKRVRFGTRPSPVPLDVLREGSTSGTAANAHLHDEERGVTTQPAKRKKHDFFEESEANSKTVLWGGKAASESKNKKDDTPLHDTIVVAHLDDDMINECAFACFNKLFQVIGHDSIVEAHYFTLHFDEHSTSCKWYEQYKRRCTTQIIVSKESRTRIFLETIRLVQMKLAVETKCRLLELLEKEGLADVHTESARRLLETDDFVGDVVLQKMMLSSCGPGCEITRQRYVSGEGEWKCFYTIHDVSTKADDGERLRWLVFGNDSDIGLAVLLHSSDRAEVSYVSGLKKVASFEDKYLRADNTDAYKALHFFSLCLLGNDYVPRLVNGSVKNIDALGLEVGRMLHSTSPYCRKYVQLLSRLVGGGGTSCTDGSLACQQSELAKALAYVLTRLLKCVYCSKKRDRPGTEDTDEVEELFRRVDGKELRDTEVERLTPCGTTALRCKEGGTKSFKEYLAAVTVCTLWYTAYCLFYTTMDEQERQSFQTKRLSRDGVNHPLAVARLPMSTPFDYNERRLHEVVRFEASNIVDIRRAVEDITTYSLIRTVETEVLEVLRK